ncbi:MAG: hypothetical protein IKI78_00780 [Clostridia bacterium]|nr:hypothetical protein [Clostridia bacterium]
MDTDKFVPAIRFCVASDTHIREDRDYGPERINKVISFARKLAGEDENHSSLDAAAFAGDLTDAGREIQFDMFYKAVGDSLGKDTRLLATVAKSHDCNTLGKAALGYYKKITGLPTDFHYVINGFHFIGISTCDKEGIYYNESQREFLKKALDEASADSPEKPVFVFHHEHVKRTVYGSSDFDGWGNDYFSDILFEYPQIIDFSGHSHYPLNDPRSIWQGEITALGTGACFYAEFTVDGERKVRPDGCYEIAQFYLVEADDKNNVRIRGYDALNKALLCEYFIESPVNKNARKYTPQMIESKAAAPRFVEGAKPGIKRVDGRIRITVPQAVSADGGIIFAYRLTAFGKGGEETETQRIINRYWLGGSGSEIVFELNGEGVAEVTITAENAFGMKSGELRAIF